MSVRRLKLKLTIFFLICFAALGWWSFNLYRQLPDERLLGAWKVDVDATLTDWRSRAPLSDSKAKFWRETYRDTEVTFYKDRYVTTFRSEARRQFFDMRSRRKNEVVIREVIEGKPVDVVIHFDGPDRIWKSFAPGEARREYYTRAGSTEEITPQKGASSPGLAAIGVQ